MCSIHSCIIALLLILGKTIGNPIESVEDDERIIGGTNAKLGEFPYQVSLRTDDFHFCGGSIISPRAILTAAHCLERKSPDEVIVVVGTNKLDSGGKPYQALKFKLHSKYENLTLSNDIALITLKTNIKFNKNVKSIVPSPTIIGAGRSVVLSGWGLTSDLGDSPNDLQKIVLKTISNSECEDQWGFLSERVICTFTQKGQGACNGDSGGPLVANGQLIGIVSFVNKICAEGNPDGFARVSSYIKWINNALK